MIRFIDVSQAPSERLLRACAAVGLGVRHEPGRADAGRPARSATAQRIDELLAPGQIALVIGPSGGGKSSLLRQIAARAQARGESVIQMESAPADVPLIDLFDLPLGPSLAILARAGLAEASLLGRCEQQLSEGEKFRLRLALAMSRCEGLATVIIDEFASVLDRTTARCLCRAVSRWIERDGKARLIVATAHCDVRAWLAPHLVAVVPLGGGEVEIESRGANERHR
jgi:ABC-type ATPase with predicted acetyltransferase domain